MEPGLAELAEKVRSALSTGDLDTYRDLLAPDAHWGAPEQPRWGCHSRGQILDWYKQSQKNGMAATIDEVVAGSGAILVGMTVRGTIGAEQAGGSVTRWQVFTVIDGQIVDIAGYDNRPEAAEKAGVAG
jgi:hypothetical protein